MHFVNCKKLVACLYTFYKTKKMKRHLLDRKSLIILNAILHDYVFGGGLAGGGKLINCLVDNNSEPIFRIRELDSYNSDERRLLVIKYKKEMYNKYTEAVLSNSNWNERYELVNKAEAMKKLDDNIVVCYSDEVDCDAEMFGQNHDVCLYKMVHNGLLFGEIKGQYLDVFRASKKEIIVDAGSFDGATDVEFVEWAGNDCKIYAFEPIKENQEKIIACIKKNNMSQNVILVPSATGDTNKEVFFNTNGDSSHVVNQFSEDFVRVHQVQIDDAVEDDITFIKMDIEGAELSALKGAKKTIQKCKPKLAICIYHNIKDLYEIPNYILSLNPEYKFVIRHYTSFLWETVLYASCDINDFKL